MQQDIEKTPRHLQRLPVLQRACDDGIPTRYVHIVREGLQTVASLFTASKSWERAYDLDECVRRWNQDLSLSVACLGVPGHLFVRYEALTQDPEGVLKPLLQALELPWQADILKGFATAADTLVADDEPWKTGVARTIRPSGTADSVLDEAQRKRALESLQSARYDAVAEHALEDPNRE